MRAFALRGLSRGASLALGALLLALLAPRAGAQVSITLSFTTTPPPLVVAGTTAGQPPATAVSGLTSWSLLGVWFVSPKITAHVATPLPTGVQLEVKLTAPLGATSTGWVPLSGTPKDVVTNLPLVAIGGLAAQYRLTATAAAGVVPLTSRSVVYTVVWP